MPRLRICRWPTRAPHRAQGLHDEERTRPIWARPRRAKVPCASTIALLVALAALDACGVRTKDGDEAGAPEETARSASGGTALTLPPLGMTKHDVLAGDADLDADRPAPRFQWPIERVRPIELDRAATWDAARGDFASSDVLMLQADLGAFALAPASGRIEQVDALDDGTFVVTIGHEAGIRSQLGGLSDVAAAVGTYVERGAAIGCVAQGRGGRVPTLTLRTWKNGNGVEPLSLIDAAQVPEPHAAAQLTG